MPAISALSNRTCTPCTPATRPVSHCTRDGSSVTVSTICPRLRNVVLDSGFPAALPSTACTDGSASGSLGGSSTAEEGDVQPGPGVISRYVSSNDVCTLAPG